MSLGANLLLVARLNTPFCCSEFLQKFSLQFIMWQDKPESSIHLLNLVSPFLANIVLCAIHIAVQLSPLLDLSPFLLWQFRAEWPILTHLLKRYQIPFPPRLSLCPALPRLFFHQSREMRPILPHEKHFLPSLFPWATSAEALSSSDFLGLVSSAISFDTASWHSHSEFMNNFAISSELRGSHSAIRIFDQSRASSVHSIQTHLPTPGYGSKHWW